MAIVHKLKKLENLELNVWMFKFILRLFKNYFFKNVNNILKIFIKYLLVDCELKIQEARTFHKGFYFQVTVQLKQWQNCEH